MNYATIKKHDIANGPGVRVSLFVSGCTHKCKNCFNPEAWDFNYGNPFTPAEEQKIIEALKPAYIRGLSILGGEPFEPQNQLGLLSFVKTVTSLYPDKTIWCYTGYLFEELLSNTSRAYCDSTKELLCLIDVLVDGEFIEEKKSLSLRFRGSENQRIIDVKTSLQSGRTILLEEYNTEEYHGFKRNG